MTVSGNIFFDSDSPQTPSDLISLTSLVTLTSHCVNQKFEELSCKKLSKFALLGDYFSDLFQWGQKLVLKKFQICFYDAF